MQYSLAGGGIPGMAIPIGGGTEIIGEAGYPAGTPSLVRSDHTTIGNSKEDNLSFYFLYERKIILCCCPIGDNCVLLALNTWCINRTNGQPKYKNT